MRKKSFEIRKRPTDIKWLRAEARSLYKVKNRLYGGFYEVGGIRVYLAWRYQHEIFANGMNFRTDAIAAGVASWAIDYETVFKMKVDGVDTMGVVVRDIGDIYLTKTQTFFDKGTSLDYSAQGGAAQIYLPLTEFTLTRAERSSRNLV